MLQLACLSHVLRQLIVFHSDLHRFVNDLKQRLGPQLQNVPLLYEGAPELKTILALFNIVIETPQETLETNELPARFQSLVESVFAVLNGSRRQPRSKKQVVHAPNDEREIPGRAERSRTCARPSSQLTDAKSSTIKETTSAPNFALTKYKR